MFRVDESRLFVNVEGNTVLAMPWGTVAITDVLMPMHPALVALDRVKPRSQVFEVLPEFKELLGTAFWRYWTRDYLRRVFDRSDPLHRMSWTMLKEVMHRFRTFDPNCSALAHYRHELDKQDTFRVWVIGHLHSAGWWSVADRKILQTGCLRDEYALDRAGRITRPISKVYAEVFLEGGREVRSQLVEVHGPEPDPGRMPDSILELRASILPLLESEASRKEVAREAMAQAEREADAAEGDPEDPP